MDMFVFSYISNFFMFYVYICLIFTSDDQNQPTQINEQPNQTVAPSFPQKTNQQPPFQSHAHRPRGHSPSHHQNRRRPRKHYWYMHVLTFLNTLVRLLNKKAVIILFVAWIQFFFYFQFCYIRVYKLWVIKSTSMTVAYSNIDQIVA